MKQLTLVLLAAFLITCLSVCGQKLKPDNMVGIAKVKPATEGMTNDQFETYYLEEFFPVFYKSFSSVPISLMKKVKGKRMGEYAEFYVFESLEERNRWFPKPGVSSEEAKKVFESMGETLDILAWDFSLHFQCFVICNIGIVFNRSVNK